MSNDLTDKIWSAIQRPSPAVSRDEIAALVAEHNASMVSAAAKVRKTGDALVASALDLNGIRALVASARQMGTIKPIRGDDGKDYFTVNPPRNRNAPHS
jgi:hypothetical protein